MRRRNASVFVLVALLLTAACSDGDDDEAGPTTTPSTTSTTTVASTSVASTSVASTTAAPATTAPATTTTTARVTAATAVVEPDTIAGIPLGTNRSEANAVLGLPSETGSGTDLAGDRYDFSRWNLAGNRGLTLYYRQTGVTAPLLSHWQVTAPGPATARGIKVGDPSSAVVTAYGPLQPFCCDVQVASVTRGPGRMIVIVEPGAAVTQIVGGSEASWSRLIAD